MVKKNLTTYVIRFTWINDFYDYYVMYVFGVKKRNECIKDMLYREEFKNIEYEAIYKSGKHGKTVKIL